MESQSDHSAPIISARIIVKLAVVVNAQREAAVALIDDDEPDAAIAHAFAE